MDVERRYARKAYYNARGVTSLRCNLNLKHYYKAHSQPHGSVMSAGSVFHNSFMVGWQSVYALDCKPGTGRLNSYPDLQVVLLVSSKLVGIAVWKGEAAQR